MASPLSSRALFPLVAGFIIVLLAWLVPGFAILFALVAILGSHAVLFLRLLALDRRGPFYCQISYEDPAQSAWEPCSWKCYARNVMGRPSIQLRPLGAGVAALLLAAAYRDSLAFTGNWPWALVLMVGILGFSFSYRLALYAQFRVAKLATSNMQLWVREQVEQGLARPLPKGPGLPSQFLLPALPGDL